MINIKTGLRSKYIDTGRRFSIKELKKLIYLFILGSLISCHGHNEYRDRALDVSRQLESSTCKDDFWNIEVLNRGSKKFVFIDNSCRVITSFSGSDFSVDTVINERNDFLPFTA